MAIWQFDLHLVSSARMMMRFGVVPLTVNKDETDKPGFLTHDLDIRTISIEIDNILPRTKSWSSKIRMWGSEEGNRIDLHMGSDGVESIFVRIDVRDIDYVFLSKLIGLAERNQWLILTIEGRLMTPSRSKLLKAIQLSDSFRFVENPEAFFLEDES